MKIFTFTLLIALLYYNTSSAQVTFIPDGNFEQALIDLGYDNVLDNGVQTATIAGVTNLDVQNRNINDLTGIQDFTALQSLTVDDNNLTSLNLNQNTALIFLSCANNNIANLDISQNTILDYLDARFNALTDIGLFNNTLLQTLALDHNALTILNLNQNSNLLGVFFSNNNLGGVSILNGNNSNIIVFDATGNPGLNCIQVDDLGYATSNWTNIDPQTSFNTNCQGLVNTYVPDDNFEQALIDWGYDFGPLDDYVVRANINTVTSLDVSNSGINDLTGIEDFIALEVLLCYLNNLTALDVSQNTALETLNCNNNQLTSLDISQNTALTVLYCNNNQLTSLDVSQNTSLIDLECIVNSITSLDVSANIALEDLDFRANQIGSIDLSNNTSLTYLNASFNLLTNLDVSQNTALTGLICETNALTNLDVSLIPNLEQLDCNTNQLTSLNVKNGNNTIFTNFNALNNPNLTCIEVDDVAYSTANWSSIDPQTSFSEDCSAPQTFVPDDNFEQALIDLGYDTVLDDYVPTDQINTVTVLDVSSLSINDLTGIEDFTALEVLNCLTNNLTNLDVSNNTNLTELNCGNNDLVSLNLNQNPNLTVLECVLNDIASLDLSQNTALIEVNVLGNQLTELDLSQNTALLELSIGANDLTTIDLSQNTLLSSFELVSNELTSLDLSQHPNLTLLNCASNQLTSLNLKNGNNTIISTFVAVNNPNLICIEVDDVAYSSANWTSIDPQTSFSEDCDAPQTFVPDDNFEQALIDLGYDTVLDDYVLTANIDAVTNLTVDNYSINDLTGIEDFTALSVLNCNNNNLTTLDLSANLLLSQLGCAYNQLTSLNISQNSDLILLFCNDNQITDLDTSQLTNLLYFICGNNAIANLDVSENTELLQLEAFGNALTDIDVSQNQELLALNVSDNQLNSLDVSNNIELTNLYCQSNSITSLDFSLNPNLAELDCSSNQLTSFSLNNGNNTDIISFNAVNNPDLVCIQVDDDAYSTANWTSIDPQTSFSEDCSVPQTFVPDDNFEQALINLGYDVGTLDDYVPTANIDTITDLNLANQNISDLTGIEDFLALETFVCSGNQITTADMSQNTALTYLNFIDNQLTNINVSQNVLLSHLYVSENQMTSIDLSNNVALDTFYAGQNLLTTIDLTQNTNLETVSITNNQLIAIDLSQNSLLDALQLISNQLTNLDLSANANLTNVECQDNNLQSFNIKNGTNTSITFFNALNNPNLECIEVDDVAYSNNNWSNIDAQTSFSEDCDGVDCESAQPITISTTSNTVNFDLSLEPTDGFGCNGAGGQNFADTWFEFTMPEDGTLGINGQVDVNLFALYESCGGTEIDCFQNQNTIDGLTGGHTYLLRVFRQDATAGNPNFTSFDIAYQETLGLDDTHLSDQEIRLYPNPASKSITLQVPNDVFIQQVHIIDVTGKRLLSQGDTNRIDVSHLPNGMYFVTVETANWVITKKLIIKS